MERDDILGWLLEGDPSIRHATGRFLARRGEAWLRRERARIATEGWGRALLARRAADGSWGGSLYDPPWISTHDTLLELVELGIAPTDAACRASLERLLAGGLLADGGVAYWPSRRPDDCVTAMLLKMCCALGVTDERVHRMVDYLLTAQLDAGGWNCRHGPGRVGASVASVHSTLSVFEALAALEEAGVGWRSTEVAAARQRACEVLLARRLYQSRRTGLPIDRRVGSFVFPPRWRFDVLRCLVAFARAGVPWDERMRPALELVERKRRRDGRWNCVRGHAGKVHLVLEPAGQPGRWNTLRALQVLDCYQPSDRPAGSTSGSVPA